MQLQQVFLLILLLYNVMLADSCRFCECNPISCFYYYCYYTVFFVNQLCQILQMQLEQVVYFTLYIVFKTAFAPN